jgi:DNA segregation ATPase FtsK/SpoIIIE, S-DNA-T family
MSAQPVSDPDNVVPLRPVQPDTAAHPWDRPVQRRPVVPRWLASRESRKHAARWASRHVAHHLAFHAIRTPKYLARTIVCTPRGLALALMHLWRWLCDRDEAGTHELRVDAAARRDHKAYATAARIRKDRVRTRSMAVAGYAALAIVVAVIIRLAWAPGLWVLAAAAAAVLAWIGRPRNSPLIDHAVVSAAAERITPDVIVRALSNLGLSGISQALRNGQDIQFIAPGVGRDGPGWRAELDLPFGVTVAEVMGRRDKLASGLRRPLACVWPMPAPGQHEGRLVLFITDKPMRDLAPAGWPLAARGTTDLFRPAPFGADQRGRGVSILLMFAGVLIGAMPRMGKTMALRLLVLFAALDVRAELRVWELKGTGDLSCAEHVAYSYGSGADDGTLQACLADVREVARELDRRAKTIRGLPRDICPENKVTPELSSKKSLGLHPLVLTISECQEAFGHPSLGKEFDQMVSAIVKRGPALGVIPLLDTQRPDAASLPGGIRANIGVRFCLRVMDQVANDMVLPTSSYQTGIRATEFAQADKGIGWLIGHGDQAEIVRTCYCDAVQADAIARRARRLREAAGTLSGYCLGEHEAQLPVIDFLADVLALTEGADRIWSETIAERLAELRPDLYRGWDATAVGDALRVRGIEPAQTWGMTADGKQANRRGVTREQLLAASAGSARPSSAASDGNPR